MYKVILILLIVFLQNLTAAQTAVLKGTVRDAETKQSLIGVNIIVKESGTGSTTNAEGEYVFSSLLVGTHTIEFSYIGYEKVTKTDIIIKPGRSNYLDVEMKPDPVEISDVVVSSGYFSEIKDKPVGAINFSSEEIRRAPGSAGDVSRIVYGLPALAKVNDSRNSLIVRGGSPVENTFYIDNIEIPNINHYPVEGSSDGPIGILNVDFIDDVTFYTGGFSPIYGDKLSSIMEIDYRQGNIDKFESQLNLNMAGAGGAVEGPIGDKGNYMLSANVSYLDLIADKAETGGAIPRYQDAQGKLVYKLNDNNKLTFLEVFSNDEINLDYEDALKTDLTNIYGSTDGVMNTAGVNWQHLWNKKGYSNTSFSHNYVDYNRNYFEMKSQRKIFTNTSAENTFSLRNINFYKLNPRHSLEFGVEGKTYLDDFSYFYGEWQDHYGNVDPSLSVDKNFNSYKVGVFALHHFQLTDKIKIDYGWRSDYFEANDNFTFSPRAAVTYEFNPTTSITASSGVFYQEIPNQILIQNDEFLKLKTPMAIHNILGVTHLLTENTQLKIEGYYKHYRNFPVDPSEPSVFIFDESMLDGIFLQHENLKDEGKAYAAGIEMMIQKKLAKDFYGMVSGSYSRTKYQDLNGEWHNRIYDNQFNFNLEGGYLLNDEWEFKARWIYAGGTPYTPFNVERSRELNEGIWDLSRINSERLPDYHSLNLRVDKRFYFDNSNMIVYLSIWNVYGRDNIAQYVWDQMKNEQGEFKQWSTLPVIGIEYEF